MTTTGSPAFTTTKWVVNRVHDNTTNRWTNTEPTGTTSRAGCFIHVVNIRDLANNSEAIVWNVANFTTW